MLTRRVVCDVKADLSMRQFERLLDRCDAIIDCVAGELFSLLFVVLPDRSFRTDFKPRGIGRRIASPDFTTYQAQYGELSVVYSASPDNVVVHEILFPSQLTEQLAMVA